MKNEFNKITKKLFKKNKKCWNCKRKHADCLHYILKDASETPLNVAPLNNSECRVGNGKLASVKVQGQMLRKTLKYLEKNNYQLTSEDRLFMLKYKRVYKYK